MNALLCSGRSGATIDSCFAVGFARTDGVLLIIAVVPDLRHRDPCTALPRSLSRRARRASRSAAPPTPMPLPIHDRPGTSGPQQQPPDQRIATRPASMPHDLLLSAPLLPCACASARLLVARDALEFVGACNYLNAPACLAAAPSANDQPAQLTPATSIPFHFHSIPFLPFLESIPFQILPPFVLPSIHSIPVPSTMVAPWSLPGSLFRAGSRASARARPAWSLVSAMPRRIVNNLAIPKSATPARRDRPEYWPASDRDATRCVWAYCTAVVTCRNWRGVDAHRAGAVMLGNRDAFDVFQREIRTPPRSHRRHTGARCSDAPDWRECRARD